MPSKSISLKHAKKRLVGIVKGIRNRWTPSYTYLFNEKEDQDSFTFQYVGWDQILRHYWINRLSQDHQGSRVKRRMVLTSRIPQYLNRHRRSFDLGLVEYGKQPYPGADREGAYLLPRWMEMVVDTGLLPEKSKVKEIRRRIRKYDLAYEFRKEKEDFDLFYHKMYKPLLIKNHGSTAEVGSYKMFSESFFRGSSELLLLLSQGTPVAAQLIEHRDGSYRILAFGILDGSHEIQKMGVHGVLYFYAMQHYQEKNQSSLMCGSSSPVALDGVTQFKLRLGARPYLQDLVERQKYQLLLQSRNSSMFKALNNNPIYHITREGLNCAVFAQKEDFTRQSDLIQMIKLVRSKNIDKIEILLLEPQEMIEDWIKNVKIPQVEYSIFHYEAH